MEDEPVTGLDDVTPGAEAQPETAITETAASDQTETQTDTTTNAATTTDDFSDEDLAWAQKKGVNLEDKRAVAKMLRNADRKVSETAVKARTALQSAVEKSYEGTVDDDVATSLMQQNRALSARMNAMAYYQDNPEDKQYDAEAVAILQEYAETDPELARGLGRNLPKLFALAKAAHQEAAVDKAKAEGRKEERKALAGKQRASATSQAATTSVIAEDDPFLKGFMNK